MGNRKLENGEFENLTASEGPVSVWLGWEITKYDFNLSPGIFDF